MRAERAHLLSADAAATEDWIRALEKKGRIDEALAALQASTALPPERRLLLQSDLAADHGQADTRLRHPRLRRRSRPRLAARAEAGLRRAHGPGASGDTRVVARDARGSGSTSRLSSGSRPTSQGTSVGTGPPTCCGRSSAATTSGSTGAAGSSSRACTPRSTPFPRRSALGSRPRPRAQPPSRPTISPRSLVSRCAPEAGRSAGARTATSRTAGPRASIAHPASGQEALLSS